MKWLMVWSRIWCDRIVVFIILTVIRGGHGWEMWWHWCWMWTKEMVVVSRRRRCIGYLEQGYQRFIKKEILLIHLSWGLCKVKKHASTIRNLDVYTLGRLAVLFSKFQLENTLPALGGGWDAIELIKPGLCSCRRSWGCIEAEDVEGWCPSTNVFVRTEGWSIASSGCFSPASPLLSLEEKAACDWNEGKRCRDEGSPPRDPRFCWL